jgi:hypothetical protein
MNFLEKHESRIVEISECGCQIWMGSTTVKGYGQAWTGRKSAAGNKVPEGAHRLSYESAFGSIPDGLHVCHTCDVPSCVNPNHLFAGSANANMQDKIRKGKQVRGTQHGKSTMAEDTVRAIRREYDLGNTTYKKLAEKFGVGVGAVGHIVRGDRWTHVETEGQSL